MKRILFVDDESAILDALRARLRGLRSHWSMAFVESGPRAIAEMELNAVDVIVSDMRMPGMDGGELLSIVSERWPETIRIVLSGYSEEEQSRRLLPIAHQFLSKPCEPDQIESVVNRCIRLHELLQDQGLRAIVGRIKKLPALPGTYTRLRAAMSRSDVSIQEVSKIVYDDPAIAAKVLQVVNSAFFRLARRITKIDQAVNYLGFIAVRNLVMSVEVFSAWGADSTVASFAPEALQTRAHKVAAAARAVAQGTSIADDALLAGLFHNIGYWILIQECPRELERAVELARREGIAMHDAERQIVGASHAELGAYLLGLWGLPYAVIEAVAFQYSPQKVGQTQFDVLAALATAESLTLADKELVPGVKEQADVPIGEEYLRSLNAPLDWAEAEKRALEASGELQP